MKIERECKRRPLNWTLLPDLESKLERLGFMASQVRSARITVSKYPDVYTFDSTDVACSFVRDSGGPESYSIWLYRAKDEHLISVYLHGSSNYDTISAHVDGEPANLELLDTILEFLGLEAAPAPVQVPVLSRSAFIAHRFDEVGNSMADKLARFLELLGFAVKTGHAYSPTSVAEKVRTRLSQQAVVLVVLTAGSDATWLTQESILAEATGKPLILLKARDAEFKAALLADHEFIPFDTPHIEGTFIGVLEGLREVGYFRGLP